MKNLLPAALALSLAAAAGAQTSPAQYTGPGSCSSASCHGGVQPRVGDSIRQNEYSTWIVQDKHARAFSLLSNPQSQRIARNLGLKQRPDAAAQCLVCHALAVPAEKRARTFDLSDGVSCEHCHGPASAWLGPHTQRGWTHEKSLQLGMFDTKDLVKRSEKCLSCHLGTAEASVDHELVAAGHPDLTFELDSYTAVMPRHWREEQDPWTSVRAWGVGQAAQLRAALQQLARRARRGPWPEYAEMDCFSCHHSLTASGDSWRQEVGYAGRRPGVPPWNSSRHAVLRLALRDADPNLEKQLAAALDELMRAMHQTLPPREEVAAIAERAAGAAERATAVLAARRHDAASTVRLLRAIVANADAISLQGERAAEQAAMAVNVLFLARSRQQSPAAADAKAVIADLFRQLENPSSYDPRRFSAQLRRLQPWLD